MKRNVPRKLDSVSREATAAKRAPTNNNKVCKWKEFLYRGEDVMYMWNMSLMY